MDIVQNEAMTAPEAIQRDSFRAIALDRCDDQIKWYNDEMDRRGNFYKWSQSTAILLGSLTPVLVVVQAVLNNRFVVLVVLISLFPTLAAIVTGLNSLFQWKDDSIRFGYTAELLKSEKVKYCTRTTRNYHAGLSEQEALDNFVRRIEAIAIQETATWRSQSIEALDLNDTLKLIEETKSSIKVTS